VTVVFNDGCSDDPDLEDPIIKHAMAFRCSIQGHEMYEVTTTTRNEESNLPEKMKIVSKCLWCGISKDVLKSENWEE
jgi:hypothetical protein